MKLPTSIRIVEILTVVAIVGTIIAAIFLLAGCSDADRAASAARGEDMRVRLWSGGVAVGEWTSQGHVEHSTRTSLLYFKDKETGLFVKIRGNISIEQIVK